MSSVASIPIWNKYTLTITEASEYFGIGEKKMRQIVADNPNADYILMNGKKCLIKRVMFERVVDKLYSI